MSANGRCALSRLVSTGCTTKNAPAGGRFFPPVVALYVVKLACERPDVIGRSLSQWDSTELARQLVRDGVVAAIHGPAPLRDHAHGRRRVAADPVAAWRLHWRAVMPTPWRASPLIGQRGPDAALIGDHILPDPQPGAGATG